LTLARKPPEIFRTFSVFFLALPPALYLSAARGVRTPLASVAVMPMVHRWRTQRMRVTLAVGAVPSRPTLSDTGAGPELATPSLAL
jgi:hypothetical protein